MAHSGKTMTFATNIVPQENNIYNLGTENLKWIIHGNLPLSDVTGADDLKAIEAISGTSGLLKKTAANTWALDTNNYVTSSGITSVTIGATSPVQSSTSTAQTGSSASTTISLKDAYGDTKNPYGAKAKNLVLAGPASGSNAAPTFRALATADIPDLGNIYVKKNSELLTTNSFAPQSLTGPYISKIDNAFYAADKRWTVTGTNISSTPALFDGNYESNGVISAGKTATITIDFDPNHNNSAYFPGYPYGYILVSFYYSSGPSSVNARVYCNYNAHGIGWHNLAFSPINDNNSTHITYRSEHQGFYNISQLEFTITAGSSDVRVTQIEMHLDRPNSSYTPFLSKYAPETLYYNLTAPKFIGSLQGNADTATTATNLANNPSIQTSGTTQITITAGGKTSSAYTVPYATSAGSATSAGKWTTARTLTIGNKGQSVDGSGNVTWSLADIGAAPASTVSCTTANVQSALGINTSSGSTSKALTEKGTWATFGTSNLTIGTTSTTAMAGNTTVTNVAISADTTTNKNYALVFGTTPSDGTSPTAAKTESLQKNSAKFYVNPSTGNIQATTFNGYTLAAASAKGVVTTIDTSANLPTSSAVKTFVEGKGYVTSSGVTSVATGAGLTGGTITGTGTIKAYLKSETKATYDSATVTNTSSRQYAVTPDKTGYLSVNVPWADTHRVIKVNGTQALASNTTALDLVAGSNVSITDGGSGAITIAATDTTYESKTAASGGTAVSLVTTGEKYNWNNKAETYYATCSTAQGTAAKVATIEAGPAFDNTDLVEGVTVRVKFTAANTAASPTLKIGSADAKPIYRYGTTAPSTSAATSWQAGSVIAFTYDGAGWQMNGWLNDNTTYSVFNSLSSANGSFVANSVVYRYQMLFHVDEDKITPLNNVSNGYNSTSKTMLTNVKFDPFGRIYYYITTTTVNANAAFAQTYLTWAYGSVDLRYTFNISASVNALTAHEDVYMKVIPQTDGKVKLAAAFPLVQSLPTYDDGYWYIYLGRAYSTYQMSLYPHHPVYYHDGTAVRELVKGADIRYTTTSTPPDNPMEGTIWLQKKPSSSANGGNMPNAMFQTVSITIPYNTATYTYSNSWITNETAIVATNLAQIGFRDTYITWTIQTGQIVFQLGSAISRNITFQVAMIK